MRPQRRAFNRWCLVLLIVGLGVFAAPLPVRAQAAWDCPAPAASAASPAAGTGSVTADASPVAAQAEAPAFPAAGGELTVFAAASLTDAFTELGDDIIAANPDVSITFNFAGSQALVTQLAEGAEADVFASANYTQMDAATEAGLVTATPVTFVQNELAIVVPADNPAGVTDPADLAQDGLRLVVANPDVPVGRYSREAVCAMAADEATFGADFLAAVAGNVVSEEDDVREVLTKVQLGEADAGIVYISDTVVAGDEVSLIEIPAAYNVVAEYPIAPLAAGDAALAEAFIGYVLGESGQAVLADYGFTPVNPAP